jgi:hypothetical protein
MSDYIYDGRGNAVGFIRGRYIHSMRGDAIGQISGTHVHKLSGSYVVELHKDMVVDKHMGHYGNIGNPGNPGNPGSPSNPGNRGAVNYGYRDVFSRLLEDGQRRNPGDGFAKFEMCGLAGLSRGRDIGFGGCGPVGRSREWVGSGVGTR